MLFLAIVGGRSFFWNHFGTTEEFFRGPKAREKNQNFKNAKNGLFHLLSLKSGARGHIFGSRRKLFRLVYMISFEVLMSSASKVFKKFACGADFNLQYNFYREVSTRVSEVSPIPHVTLR